ncbi:rhomboid family intramembrane serine protease [Rhodococcus triatomae]|uniref:Membrane associated serine protease, rhomboid family n=1 Tax=Rhodococcus triatomae TaxID=300028 RepID=A0A1G8QUH1_9NOCA|nr:rhomboid family intramembrane serine protease [Rhodococcus triatomae]QNG20784.1 rhomboid family intramembrane serine protease [Rhodococcus triatomae]QNG23300.1 rhomboid family intramembrane serine protease [Rhodococcus triatomae]SDJ08301.1 Membrane associated serine protease, rhomboid family [Rhodococcus triatomae]
MTNPGWGGAANEGAPFQPRCVRHPDRPTGLACTRCGRPSCPDCLREASVGYQCVDCVAAGRKDVRQARTVAGAPLQSQRAQPYATYTLMGLNVLAFLVTVAQSRSIMDNHRGSSLFEAWALFSPYVALGEWVRVVGSGFLHFGLMHLAVNMFALYIFGRDVEFVLGRARFAAVYVISILGGSAAVMAFDTISVTAGASGAVFGLLGAELLILLKMRRSPTPIIAIIVLNVVISVTIPGISFWGHLGGLLAGAAATAGLLYVPGWLGAGNQRDKVVTIGWSSLAIVGLVTLGLIGVRIVQLRDQMGL